MFSVNVLQLLNTILLTVVSNFRFLLHPVLVVYYYVPQLLILKFEFLDIEVKLIGRLAMKKYHTSELKLNPYPQLFTK